MMRVLAWWGIGQVDLIGAQVGLREGLVGGFAHGRDRVLEDGVALHVDGVGEGDDALGVVAGIATAGW